VNCCARARAYPRKSSEIRADWPKFGLQIPAAASSRVIEIPGSPIGRPSPHPLVFSRLACYVYESPNAIEHRSTEQRQSAKGGTFVVPSHSREFPRLLRVVQSPSDVRGSRDGSLKVPRPRDYLSPSLVRRRSNLKFQITPICIPYRGLSSSSSPCAIFYPVMLMSTTLASTFPSGDLVFRDFR